VKYDGLVDGIQYLPKRLLCAVCNGTGDKWHMHENWGCLCPDCGGDGVVIDYCGVCIQCNKWTANKSHDEYLCTECDVSRQIVLQINYPDRYTRRLL